MQKLSENVKSFYNQAGEYFSRSRSKIWPEAIPYLKSLRSGDAVLDLGCGNGRLLTGIQKSIDYLGVDFSETMLSQAKKMHPDHRFLLADISHDDAWKNLSQFDAIFCIATLHHIAKKQDQMFIIKKAKKHLKKGGLLFISVWNLWQPKYWQHHLNPESLKLKLRNWRWLRVPFQNKHQRFLFAFDPPYLRDLLQNSGFENLKLYYSDRLGNPTNFLKGKNLCASNQPTLVA